MYIEISNLEPQPPSIEYQLLSYVIFYLSQTPSNNLDLPSDKVETVNFLQRPIMLEAWSLGRYY